MLSPRREHRCWGPEGPKMEPRTHLERSCEAKRYSSMRCAPTPPQCPLPSILIAVCVPMSSHCDFFGMCAQHLVAFVRGNYVTVFAKARCECLFSFAARTSKSMPNPSKNGPKQARGYPLEGPERSKTAQGHPGTLQETPRDGQKASPRALLRRFWRVLSAIWASRRSL